MNWIRLSIALAGLPILASGAFTNRTTELFAGGLSSGNSAWCDFNNDGYADLYTSGALHRNDGGTNFTALPGHGWGIWGDFNNDGAQDIFDLDAGRVMRNDGGTGSFTQIDLPEMPGNDNRGACWADLNGDAYLDLYVGAYEATGYEFDSVLSNHQGKAFMKVWEEPAVPPDNVRFPGRGVTACDFDQDGDPDIYVSNYRIEANYLWLNDGNGGLTDVATDYGVAGTYDGWRYSYGHSIGSSWGDMNNDGFIDLLAGNFSHPQEWQDRARFYQNLGPSKDWHFEQKWELTGDAWQESYATPALAD